MEASGSRIHCRADSEKEVGVDRAHLKEAAREHYTSGSELEPPGEEEERSSPQQLEERY